MNVKNRKSLMALLLAAPFILSGCATQYIPLETGAQNVKVVDATASPIALPPLSCDLKGHVLGSYVTPVRLKNTNLTESEVNLIKNKAFMLHANLAVIHKNAVVVEGNNYNHVTLSDVYDCHIPPQNEIALPESGSPAQ